MSQIGSAWAIDLSDEIVRAVKLHREGETAVRLSVCRTIDVQGQIGDTGANWPRRLTTAMQILAQELDLQATDVVFAVAPSETTGERDLGTLKIRRERNGSVTQVPRSLVSSAVPSSGEAAAVRGLQIAPLALHNFLAHETGNVRKPTAIVDVCAKMTHVLVIAPQHLHCQTVPIGGDNLTAAIARKTESGFYQADEIKSAPVTPTIHSAVYQAVIPTMRTLLQQVKGFVASVTAQEQIDRLAEAKLLGACFGLPGMATFFADALDCPVQEVASLERVQNAVEGLDRPLRELLPVYAKAIGAGLQALGHGPVKANLLRRTAPVKRTKPPEPPPVRREGTKQWRVSGLIAAGAILVATLIGVAVGRAGRAPSTKTDPAASEAPTADLVPSRDDAGSTPENPAQVASMQSPPLPTGPRSVFALLIGISEYESDIPRLEYAAKDATDVCRLLVGQGTFPDRVKLLTDDDATTKNVQKATRAWLTRSRDATLFIHWSGHGFADPNNPNECYFACHDTPADALIVGYKMTEFIEDVKAADARHTLVVLDTCHAGKATARGERGPAGMTVGPANNFTRLMAQQQRVPPGMAIIAAGAADRKALESSDWQNGALTQVVIQALSGGADGYRGAGPKDGWVTLGELRYYVHDVLPKATSDLGMRACFPEISISTGDARIGSLPLTKVAAE